MGGETGMSFHRRLALRLMDHAFAVMPAERCDWAEAMRAEFAVMPTDRDALAWAAGCVWASYCERIDPMNLFLKSLLRALAVWLVVPSFLAVMMLLNPLPDRDPEIGKLVRILSELYGGMFVTLWVCELLIARFWNAPNKLFKKTLLRTAALWLWPFGEGMYRTICFLLDPQGQKLIAPVFWQWLRHWLWDWVTNLSVMFIVIFVPLLICEWLMVRYWWSRQERVA